MSVTTWADFKQYVSQLNETTNKGKHFELFCFYLLQLYPKYNYRIRRIWLYSDFPSSRKGKLGLYQRDMGTDLVFKLKEEYCHEHKYVAVQCKFVTDENHTYTHKQLSTFCEDASILKEGLLISTQNKPTNFNGNDHLENRTISQITLQHILELERNEPELMKKIIECTFESVNNVDKNAGKTGGAGRDVARYDMSQMTERPYQMECLEAGMKHFLENNKGFLWAAGGCGKTFMSIRLHNELWKVSEINKLMIVVPSLFLIEQTMKYFVQIEMDREKNFIINFCSIREKTTSDVKYTTSENELTTYLNQYESLGDRNLVMLVTYASVEKCFTILNNRVNFNTIIFDEAHTLMSQDRQLSNWFLAHHKTLPCHKQIFLSATPKNISLTQTENTNVDTNVDNTGVDNTNVNNTNVNNTNVDNTGDNNDLNDIEDNKINDTKNNERKITTETKIDVNDESQFGSVFYRYSMRRAINEGFLSDYRVYVPMSSTITIKHVILFLKENNLLLDEKTMEENFTDKEKIVPVFWRLMVAAFSIKDAFDRGKTKCFAICNKIKDMKLLTRIVNLLCAIEGMEIFSASIDGKMKTCLRNQITSEFENTTKKALIVSVRTLTTGADIPCIDSVCIVNPIRSESLIVQIICRGIRLYKNKVLDILIPMLEDEKSFDTMQHIILALENEDEEFMEMANHSGNKILKVKNLDFKNQAYKEWFTVKNENKIQQQPLEVPIFDIEKEISQWRMKVLSKENIYDDYLRKTRLVISITNYTGRMIRENEYLGNYVSCLKVMYCNRKNNKKPCFSGERMREFRMLSECKIWVNWYGNKVFIVRSGTNQVRILLTPDDYMIKTKYAIQIMKDTGKSTSSDKHYCTYIKHLKRMFKNTYFKKDKGFSVLRMGEFELLKSCKVFMKWFHDKIGKKNKEKSTPAMCLQQTQEIIQIINKEGRVIENTEYHNKNFLKALKNYFKSTYFKVGKGFHPSRMKEFYELEKCAIWMTWINAK